MYLITYYHKNDKSATWGIHYDVADNVEKWVDDSQVYEGDTYVLINVLEISIGRAAKWDGSLKSM